MPIYVFTCKKCRKQSEQLLKVDEPPELCECGGEQHKEVTFASPRFKGPGWGGNELTPDGAFTIRTQQGKPSDTE